MKNNELLLTVDGIWEVKIFNHKSPAHQRQKAGNSTLMIMKSAIRHEVYMYSMWFSFQQFGLCMPFSPNSVNFNYIKTCHGHQNIPLKKHRRYNLAQSLYFSFFKYKLCESKCWRTERVSESFLDFPMDCCIGTFWNPAFAMQVWKKSLNHLSSCNHTWGGPVD